MFAESTLTVAEIRAVRRKLDRTLGLERKRYKQLYRSIGAVPAAPDGSGGSGKDDGARRRGEPGQGLSLDPSIIRG